MVRRFVALSVVIIGMSVFAGCDKSATTASDDDIYRAMARADGESEDEALARAHRVKETDPLVYVSETKKLREYIKYSGGDDGNATLEDFVKRKQSEKRAAKLSEEFEKTLDTKYSVLEKKLRGEYDAKAAAKENENFDTNPQKFNQAQAIRGELGGKLKALEEQRNQEAKEHARGISK